MFRVAAFAIVLTVTAGPSTGLLCVSWCHPQAAAARGCHHEDSGPTVAVAAAAECDDAILGIGAFLSESAQRGVSQPDGDRGVPVPRYQFSPRTFDRCAGQFATPERMLDQRPRSTTLRI